MARANSYTLLSLDRFARILGLNPVHFAGAEGGVFFPDTGNCKDVWPQYAWQGRRELVSRDDLAQAIADAERDLEQILGYPLAPRWYVDEPQRWPPDPYGGTLAKRIKLGQGKVLAPGQRALTLLDADAAVVYSDPDADTWNERATVTVTGVTGVTDVREIKLYFAGHAGDPTWEIRPLLTRTLASGTFTATCHAWLLIDPALWEQLPSGSGDYEAIDISTTANYVTEVEVYREYNDTTAPATTFVWGAAQPLSYGGICLTCSGVGCDACVDSEQNGCFGIYDGELGIVWPTLADYTDGAWVPSYPALCRGGPVRLKFSYQAGHLANAYKAGLTDDPLDDHFAQAIAWLAVARLIRPLCDCTNVANVVRELQRDATWSHPDHGFYTRYEKMDVFDCPLGTKIGEVKAWQRIKHLVTDAVFAGGLL